MLVMYGNVPRSMQEIHLQPGQACQASRRLVILVQSDVKGGWAYGRIVASETETSFLRAQGFFPLAHCKALEPIKVKKPNSQDPRQAGVGLAVAFSHGIYGRLLIFSVKKGSVHARDSQHAVIRRLDRFGGRSIMCDESERFSICEIHFEEISQVGDEILAIDDRPVQHLDYREIANMILGLEGSVLKINVVDSILKIERSVKRYPVSLRYITISS
eukprot:698094-Hanusia_phi.AAC.2